jgi:hypothetical protein
VPGCHHRQVAYCTTATCEGLQLVSDRDRDHRVQQQWPQRRGRLLTKTALQRQLRECKTQKTVTEARELLQARDEGTSEYLEENILWAA